MLRLKRHGTRYKTQPVQAESLFSPQTRKAVKASFPKDSSYGSFTAESLLILSQCAEPLLTITEKASTAERRCVCACVCVILQQQSPCTFETIGYNIETSTTANRHYHHQHRRRPKQGAQYQLREHTTGQVPELVAKARARPPGSAGTPPTWRRTSSFPFPSRGAGIETSLRRASTVRRDRPVLHYRPCLSSNPLFTVCLFFEKL